MDDGALGLFFVHLLAVAYGVLGFLFCFCFVWFFFSFCPSWSLPDVIRACEPLSNCNSQA